jgi:hypothetical protein
MVPLPVVVVAAVVAVGVTLATGMAVAVVVAVHLLVPVVHVELGLVPVQVAQPMVQQQHLQVQVLVDQL